jgi:hypothetical protein
MERITILGRAPIIKEVGAYKKAKANRNSLTERSLTSSPYT